MAILVSVSAVLPVLVRVTVCKGDDVPAVVETKVRLDGDGVAAGPDVAPAPVRAAVCGELRALSAKLSVAETAPTMVGLKVTVAVQEALTASVAPHVVVCEKGVVIAAPDALVAPVMVMPEMVRAPVPELVRVTVCVAEVAPTMVDAKLRLAGDMAAAGPEAAVEGHPLTTLATLSEPRPVALS